MSLQKYLEHQDAAVRGTVISGFRYTLSSSSAAYNDVLRPLIVQFLVTMLNDSELSNHRLAMTTVNSAIHNKANQVLPHLGQLLPTIMADAHVKPELVREVQMGPFKHKVDDGLELRKVWSRNILTRCGKICINRFFFFFAERVRNALHMSRRGLLQHHSP